MMIKGIGSVKKSEMMSILTNEGREAVKDGTLSMDEVAAMYKLELVKKASVIGNCNDTFTACYDQIPDGITDSLTPTQIAALVDTFYRLKRK